MDENAHPDLEFHLKKSINPKVAYRGAVLHAIDEAYGTAEDRKMHDFFEDMNEDELEIGDGVRPEGRERGRRSYNQNAFTRSSRMQEMRARIFTWSHWKEISHPLPVDGKLSEQQDPPKRLQPSIISRTSDGKRQLGGEKGPAGRSY